MIERIVSLVQKYRMFQEGDCVTVGLSGGADSVALLYLLQELAPRYRLSLSACHVNHQLRGEAGEEDERFCRDLCRRLGVPLICRRIPVKEYCKVNKLSIEDGARQLRYQALLEEAPGKIATAHHADDNAETVLLHLLRGTALDGLCGIPPVRGRIVRPLLGVERAELEAYLQQLGQPYRTDGSNLEDLALRNRLRHSVMPRLKEENPSFSTGIFRMAETLRSERDLLETQARELLDRAALAPEICRIPLTGLPPGEEVAAWDRSLLLAQPQPLRLRALRRICADYAISYSNARLLLFDQFLQQTGAVQIEPDLRLVVTGDRCALKWRLLLPSIQPTVVSTDSSQQITISGGRVLRITPVAPLEIKLFVNNCNYQFENLLDCDKIYGIATLRSRWEGDRVQLRGESCSRSLKKRMNAAAIPPSFRPGLAVLADETGIVWAEGFGVADRVAVTPETHRAILLEIHQEETQHDAG